MRARAGVALLAVVLSAVAGCVATVDPRPAGGGPVAAPACSYEFDRASWDAREPPRTAMLVGDSLVGQVSGLVDDLAAQRCHDVTPWALSGAAPCDLLPSYGDRLAGPGPELTRVTLAFVGNASSPCMLAALGWTARGRPPPTLTAAEVSRVGSRYEDDLRAMVRWNLAHDLETVLVLPPAMGPGTWHGQVNDELIARMTAIGGDYGGAVRATGAPRDVLGGDTYRATLGGVPIRKADDGTHLAAPLGQQLYAAALVTASTSAG
jgi:hypothetical protein